MTSRPFLWGQRTDRINRELRILQAFKWGAYKAFGMENEGKPSRDTGHLKTSCTLALPFRTRARTRADQGLGWTRNLLARRMSKTNHSSRSDTRGNERAASDCRVTSIALDAKYLFKKSVTPTLLNEALLSFWILQHDMILHSLSREKVVTSANLSSPSYFIVNHSHLLLFPSLLFSVMDGVSTLTRSSCATTYSCSQMLTPVQATVIHRGFKINFSTCWRAVFTMEYLSFPREILFFLSSFSPRPHGENYVFFMEYSSGHTKREITSHFYIHISILF